MISVIVIEDDPIFRDMLLDMLPKAKISTKVQAACATLRQAKEAIDQHKPQLIFLDVELPDGKGMELFQHYEDTGTFETVFVTAFGNYAIQALNQSAAYYLLKPIDIDELVKAVDKIKDLTHLFV